MDKYIEGLPAEAKDYTPETLKTLRARFEQAKTDGADAATLKALAKLGKEATAAVKAAQPAKPAKPVKEEVPETPAEPVTDKELAKVMAEANKVLVLDPPIKAKDEGAKERLLKELKDLRAKDLKSDDPEKLVFSEAAVAIMRRLGVKIPGEGKAKKAKGAGGERKPGVIAAIAELIAKKAMTKDEIAAELALRFPERDAEGMRRTVGIQLPGRMAKDKGLKIEVKDGKYKIVK